MVKDLIDCQSYCGAVLSQYRTCLLLKQLLSNSVKQMQTFLNQSMIRNLPLCFPGVALIIISNIQTTESVSCPPNNGIYEGVKYTGSESYSEIRSIGPIRCFHECSLFTGCTFVNYDKMQFICYLFNTELNETSVKPDVGFAIMHNISQDKVCTYFLIQDINVCYIPYYSFLNIQILLKPKWINRSFTFICFFARN